MQANFSLWTEIAGKRRVADFLVENLEKAGVTHIFAMPAESLNPIIDAIRKNGKVKIVSVRHEGNGTLMASAYSKLSGNLGVSMGTTGPGASHLPIGIYDAKADRTPLLAITGQVPIHQVGAGGFQEIDTLKMYQDAVGFNRLVASPEQTSIISLACTQAITNKAPTHLAFASNVLGTSIGNKPKVTISREQLSCGTYIDKESLQKAVAFLGTPQIILVGDVSPDIRCHIENIAQITNAGICLVNEGVYYSKNAGKMPFTRITNCNENPVWQLSGKVERCLVVGAMSHQVRNFLNRVSVDKFLHVAPISDSQSPVEPKSLRLIGDTTAIVESLKDHVKADDNSLSECLQKISDSNWSPNHNSKDFWQILDKELPEDAVIALEPGTIFDTAFFHFPVKNRTITSSFNFQIKGYAFPAAMAAAIVRPKQKAFAISSEKGLVESMSDFLSARKYNLPVKVLCLENIQKNKIGIDYVAFAKSSQMNSWRLGKEEEFSSTMNNLISENTPTLVSIEKNLHNLEEEQVEIKTEAQLQKWGHTLVKVLEKFGCTRVYASKHSPLSRFFDKTSALQFQSVTFIESASMMASAYAKKTGNIGVCLAKDDTEIPFLVNGLYDALFDHAPVIAITNTKSGIIDPQKFLSDVAQFQISIDSTQNSLAILEQALKEAKRNKTVVHIQIDWEKLDEPAEELTNINTDVLPETYIADKKLLEEAVSIIEKSRFPAILVGRGAKEAPEIIMEIASLLQAPIVSTMPGRGIIPDTHPHMVGAIGASGHRAAIDVLEKCDALLILGSSCRGAIFGFVGNFTIIQIDNDALQLGRRPQKTIGLYGDVKYTLEILQNSLKNSKEFKPKQNQFVAHNKKKFNQWFQKYDLLRLKNKSPIKPSTICHHLSHALEKTKQEAIVTIDVGVTTLWVYRHFIGEHQTIWSSSFATMGFSMPAAIAIKETHPQKTVIAMVGDGGIAITMSELANAVQKNIPMIAVIFNNNKLAAIKFEQEVMGWPEYESYLFNCNFAEYAKSCGAHGIRVTEASHLPHALEEAITCGKPCIVDIVCDPHEKPFPPKIHVLQGSAYVVALCRELFLNIGSFFRGSGNKPQIPTRYNDNDIILK